MAANAGVGHLPHCVITEGIPGVKSSPQCGSCRDTRAGFPSGCLTPDTIIAGHVFVSIAQLGAMAGNALMDDRTGPQRVAEQSSVPNPPAEAQMAIAAGQLFAPNTSKPPDVPANRPRTA